MTRVTVSIVFHAALIFLLASGGLARAGVITTGNVNPDGAGTHSNPWVIGAAYTSVILASAH